MAELIPVRRMDKNGVMTTKWVIPSSDQTSAKDLPAPSPLPSHILDDSDKSVSKKTRSALLDRLVDDFVHRVNNNPKMSRKLRDDEITLRRVKTADHLDQLSLRLVDAMWELRDDSMFPALERWVERGESQSLIGNYMTFAGYDYGVMYEDGDYLKALIRSIDCYPQFSRQEGFLDADPLDKSKVQALLKVAGAIGERHKWVDEVDDDIFDLVGCPYDHQESPVIVDASLIDFVMANHERADDIAAVITDRGVYSPEEISVVIGHGVRAVASGAL